jgi:hypothetical protein
MSSERMKHLEFVQAVIARLAGNSFQIKTFTVTLVAALFALAAKETSKNYAIIALLPAAMFWGLDAYFLRQERLFRALYRKAVADDAKCPLFSMDCTPFACDVAGWIMTIPSKTLWPFYGPIMLSALIATRWI